MLQYRLNDEQLRDLTAFLLEEYSSADTGSEPAPVTYQDARLLAAGRDVFERRGCASCHQLAAIRDAGRIGPSLAGIADRDPDALGMEGRIGWGEGDVEKLVRQAGRWRDAQATHLSVNTMGAGFGSIDEHLAALAVAADALAPLDA